MRRFHPLISTLFISLLLGACGGGGSGGSEWAVAALLGAQGINATAAPPPEPPPSPTPAVATTPNMLTSIVNEAIGANCAYGGSKVSTGPDSNANGVLDAEEVTATNYACNCTSEGWVEVTGAVQAQSNMCYVARGDTTQVVLTLPANPAVGDLVRVKGAGPGGWKIAQNTGQAVYTQKLGGMAGAIWTERESDRAWSSVASSADGSKLMASEWNGRIHTSTDSGATWTPRASDRGWHGVASSADGSKLVALDRLGQVHTSTDSGVTWSAHGPIGDWVSVASSADGRKLLAMEYMGRIHTSIDGGESWTRCTGPTAPCDRDRYWGSVASSADGSRMVAVEWGGQIYTSADSGVSWTAHESSRNWYSVASSADGMKLMAGVYGGQIYTSTDGGANWTARESSRLWQGTAASSADGDRLVTAVVGGRIYMSNDSGVSWTARQTDRAWTSLASSADGSKMVGAVDGGRIYTSVATTSLGAAGAVSGTATDAIELQYVGDGMFTVLSHQGSPAIQ